MNEEQPVIWYVTMAFPVPSEAFASVEIRELRRQGIDVQVKTLRQRRRDHATVSRQQRTDDLHISHATPFAVISGLIGWLRHPLVALRLYLKLCQALWHRPKVLAGAYGGRCGVLSYSRRSKQIVLWSCIFTGVTSQRSLAG